jgi:hypothetical protein
MAMMREKLLEIKRFYKNFKISPAITAVEP